MSTSSLAIVAFGMFLGRPLCRIYLCRIYIATASSLSISYRPIVSDCSRGDGTDFNHNDTRRSDPTGRARPHRWDVQSPMSRLAELGIVALIGLVTTSSCILGVAVGLYAPLSKPALCCVLAFADGALIGALAIEPASEG